MTNDIQSIVGGTIALIVVVFVGLMSYRGDATAAQVLFTLATAAGVAFIQHKGYNAGSRRRND